MNIRIVIKKDSFGRFIDEETKFVFNQANKFVIGKGNIDGTISDLTEEDKKLCRAMKFNYNLVDQLIDELSCDSPSLKKEDKKIEEKVEKKIEEVKY